MLNFNFSEKGLGLVPAAHFVYDFGKEMFLMLDFNLSNFIVWLPLLLKILGNMCILFICQAGRESINFKTNLILLIEPFSYMTKK